MIKNIEDYIHLYDKVNYGMMWHKIPCSEFLPPELINTRFIIDGQPVIAYYCPSTNKIKLASNDAVIDDSKLTFWLRRCE